MGVTVIGGSGSGGGGGLPPVDATIYLGRESATVTIDDAVFLRSGHIETNTALYPDATPQGPNLILSSFLQSFSVTNEEANPTGVFFKPDGTKMYIVGYSGDEVNEYDLSTAWDINTASSNTPFSIAGQDTTPQDIFFKPDGTKMYIIGGLGDDVNEYNLSTAWDISTASYVQNFSVAAQDASPTGIFFKPDGTKMYIVGGGGDAVNEYNLSTAWDISTSVHSKEFYIGSQETLPTSISFNSDGLKMYVVGRSFFGAAYEYNLSTAWDISTAYFRQQFSVTKQTTFPQGVFFKPDGTKMYVLGGSVHEYDVPTNYVGLATAVFEAEANQYIRVA